MANYLFVYVGGEMAATPAAQKKSMDAWMAWFGKLGKAVVDMGASVKPGKIVGKNGVKAVGANPVTGYTVVKADSLDAAVAMAKSNPDIAGSMQIGVYEIVPM
jgi:hypothetical protein